MRALAILMALACATAAIGQATVRHPPVEDILAASFISGRGAPGDIIKQRFNDATDFGNGFKASVMPLVNKALVEIPAISVGPWYPVSGFKIPMTWKAGDNLYYSGDQLYADVGRGVFGITAPIDTPIDAADASQGTFRDFYGGRFNHLQPDKPAAYTTLIDDNKITAASVTNVLDQFPYKNPAAPYTAITADQFTRLKTVFYEYKRKHLELPYVSLLFPFAVKGITGGTTPLLPLEKLITNMADVKNGARPIFNVLDNGPDYTYSEVGGDGRWIIGGIAYTFKLKYDYYFQEVPSKLDIDQNGAAGLNPKSYRNGANDFDGPMAMLFSASPGGTAPPAAGNAVDNTDNNIPPKLRLDTNSAANDAWLAQLATDALPAEVNPAKIGYAPANPPHFFRKLSSNGGNFAALNKQDLMALNTNPALSRLAVMYAPHPTVAFSPQHFADGADASPIDMENELRTANPPVAVKKMREGSMQVYVVATAQVLSPGTAIAGPEGNLIAEYKVIDDNYILTPFVSDPYLTLDQLNAQIASDGLRGGTYVKNADPFDRLPDFSRNAIPTPARVDTRLTVPGPEDKLLAYFPDPRLEGGAKFLNVVTGKEGPPIPGDPNSLGNAFFEAHVGRGPSYNYVFDRDGAAIDPTRPESPQRYWANPRHVALVWPYRVRTPAGTETVVGPYVLDLSETARLAAANGNSAKFVYTYAQSPWHDKDNPDNDRCIPVVIAEPLRSVINKLIDNPGTVDVHMTADADSHWGKPQAPGANPDYRYTACITIVDANKEPLNSLAIRVPCSDDSTTPPTLIPNPGSFVPVNPAFPTFEGKLTDPARGAMNAALIVNSDGTPAKPDQYYVAAYDSRCRSSAGSVLQIANVAGLDQKAREILSAGSLDQSVKAQVVDGCGRISTIASDTIVGVPAFRPSASITFVPADDPSAAYTVGVPIAAKHFQPLNVGANQFTAPSATSLGSRINDLNRPFLAGNISPEFDGTEAPGTDKNPGDEFFRPTDAVRQRVVKGRSVRMEILAESQVQPGFDIYDDDNPGQPDRTRFAGNVRNAAFIRRIDVAVYPPGVKGVAGDAPEKKVNLFFFNTLTDISSAPPLPPMANFEYVFREATTTAPAGKGKVADADRHYLVRVDIEDMAGNSRAIKIPVWVTDEGVSTDALSTEHQKK